ncbi:MAG: hypothetical protein A2Y93_01275 [Chloroflexi bacterium RBG_13_68_17]|jgi:hypothetical protein|nr:MAG: hypothetical protein A2Y93_01275 [Chloroflexi bacterium RBG_13_68_17]
MTGRRLAVWILSALFGVAGAFGIVFAFRTTFERFSYASALLVFLALGSLAFIWLDYFLKTSYLRR